MLCWRVSVIVKANSGRAVSFVRRSVGIQPGTFSRLGTGAQFVRPWLLRLRWVKVKALLPAPKNLAVYLSADFENVVRMARAGGRLGLPLAMLANDTAHAAELWARALAVAPVPSAVECPASGKWARDSVGVSSHVVGLDGRRSSAVRGGLGAGACPSCRVCLPAGATRSVTFLLHGGKNKGATAGRLGAAVSVRVRRGLVTL